MIYMMFGGKLFDVEEGGLINPDGNNIEMREAVKVGRSFLGVEEDRDRAIEFCKSRYPDQIEWFEVIEFHTPQESTIHDYGIRVVYDDEIYQVKLSEAKHAAELKKITPESFALFLQTRDGNWGYANYPTLEVAILHAYRSKKLLDKWSIKSVPQDRYVCKRENGFPGREIFYDSGDAYKLDRLISMWSAEWVAQTDPNFDIGKD